MSVRKWVDSFKKYEKDGLLRKSSYTTYLIQFKLDVLNYKLRTGESFREVALKFGIPEHSIIANWMKKWQNEGTEGFSKPKGHPSLTNNINVKIRMYIYDYLRMYTFGFFWFKMIFQSVRIFNYIYNCCVMKDAV
jgi:hypothetical protein